MTRMPGRRRLPPRRRSAPSYPRTTPHIPAHCPRVSAYLRVPRHICVHLRESPHISAYLREYPHISAYLDESRRACAGPRRTRHGGPPAALAATDPEALARAELHLIAALLRSQFGPATVNEEHHAVELEVGALCLQVSGGFWRFL